MNHAIEKKTGWACAALLGIMLPLVSGASDFREGPDHRRTGIEGVWDTTVTVLTCDSRIILRTFRGTNLFEDDGSNVATSVAAPTPTLGRWRYLGGRAYLAVGRFFRYDTAGTFLGWTRLTRTINMQPDQQSFTSSVKIEQFDIFDNPEGSSCGTEISKRLY